MSFSSKLDSCLFLTNRSVEERLAESAAKIAFHNFEWRFVTFVFFNTTLLCGEEIFAKFYNKSIIVSQSEYDKPNAQSIKQLVLFGTNNKNIEFILHWMQKRLFDNTCKHVVICISENKGDCNESEAIRVFWHYKVINVVYFRRATNKRGIVGYTYYPLADSLCDINPPVRLTNLDACIDVSSKDNCKMFPKKLRNLHGCSLIAATFEDPPYVFIKNKSKAEGVVGDMMWLLGERLNASIKILTPRKSWIDSLQDVYDDYANFSLSHNTISNNRTKYFDMSISYNFVHFVWINRPTTFEPSAFKLLRPICKYSRLAVAATYAFVVAIELLTKTQFWTELSSKTNMDRPGRSVMFYSWMLFMGLPTNVLPKKRTLLAIVYIWIWYTFLIRTIYQAALINSLNHNVYLSNYETVEAAIEAGYPLGGGIALKEYYLDYPMIHKKWITLNASDIYTSIETVSDGFKFVQAVSLEHVNVVLRMFKDRKLYILPQQIAASPTVVYFKKFSPLMKPVNHVLQRLIEAGFTRKFNDDYTKVPVRKDPETNKPITLEHFKGCYIVLFIGWVVSFVLFICEITLAKWTELNKK